MNAQPHSRNVLEKKPSSVPTVNVTQMQQTFYIWFPEHTLHKNLLDMWYCCVIFMYIYHIMHEFYTPNCFELTRSLHHSMKNIAHFQNRCANEHHGQIFIGDDRISHTNYLSYRIYTSSRLVNVI